MRPNQEVSLDDAYGAGYLQESLAAARAYRLAVHDHHATPAVAIIDSSSGETGGP